MTTTSTTPPADVPPPPGATKVYDWCDIGSQGAFREFEGTSSIIESEAEAKGIEVVVVGLQLADGHVEGLHVKVYGDEDQLTAERARRLAAALLAAADEIDRFEGRR
ncbi:MAG: hypothetical protein WBZ15_16385 [Mycobacterium sp.]|jgi:hypothetical protein|uniref:hypothetical protein n=1 Tax=Mycobacterium sp. TaxID=1785 RepID=UPI0028B3F08E|nr:hypothetical protein [Mycobacterium sp.]MDT5275145.1 hypothetical protein [Mycobacterium sp.]MDT5309044.1 hypothetical protein [Mycobacterium sp.]MDT5357325.1 hypothetical protein [Mycobacterium sp.]